MSLLTDSFYGPAIEEWLQTDGGCAECKTAIKARAEEIQPRSWFETKDFNTWYSGNDEFLLPASATVQKYLDAFRSSSFDEIEGGWEKCMTYLTNAAGLLNRERNVDILKNSIIQIVLARVAPKNPISNFIQRIPEDLTGTDAIDWEGIQYLRATRSGIPLVARDGHKNCPKWSNWL
jgi:hypothetical protein